MNTLLNRDFAMPGDGWFQLVPIGEHRLRLNRKLDSGMVAYLENRGVTFPAGDRVSILQVIDEAAVTAMAAAFNREAAAPHFPGLLVDEDHFSEDLGKSSAARGWIHNVEPRADGLYGQIRFVDPSDVTSGRFRFLSPVFDPSDVTPVGGNRVRPTRLDSAALTNKPNMRTMRPLSNRDAETGKESTVDYKAEYLALLGLTAEATEEDIAAARSKLEKRLEAADQAEGQRNAAQEAHAKAEQENAALKNRAEQAEARAVALERAQLERDVESDLTEFAAVIANREEAKAALLANRDGTRKLMGALKAKAEAPREPLRNRADAQTPDLDQDAKLANRRREQTAAVDALIATGRFRSRAEALERAAHDHPELFR